MSVISSRRRFLLGAGVLFAAPALVKVSSLMPISVPRPPKLWGDGIHDDTKALQWFIDNNKNGIIVIPEGLIYRVTNTLRVALTGSETFIVRNSTFIYDDGKHVLNIERAGYFEINKVNFISTKYLESMKNT